MNISNIDSKYIQFDMMFQTIIVPAAAAALAEATSPAFQINLHKETLHQKMPKEILSEMLIPNFLST